VALYNSDKSAPVASTDGWDEPRERREGGNIGQHGLDGVWRRRRMREARRVLVSPKMEAFARGHIGWLRSCLWCGSGGITLRVAKTVSTISCHRGGGSGSSG
jgi:hypothetical protein